MYSTAIAGFGVRKEEPSFIEKLAKSPLVKGVVGALAVGLGAKPVEAGCDVWTQVGGMVSIYGQPKINYAPLLGVNFTSNNTGVPVDEVRLTISSYVLPENFTCPEPLNTTFTTHLYTCSGYNMTAEEFTDAIQPLEISAWGPSSQYDVSGNGVTFQKNNCNEFFNSSVPNGDGISFVLYMPKAPFDDDRLTPSPH